MKGLSEILRGANGGLEINRVVGAFGGFAYIISVPAFEAASKHWGFDFDVTAYSLAYAGGLATIGVGTGAAVALKDRNVAVAAKKTAEAAHVDEPQQVEVVNTPQNPANVTDTGHDELPDYARP